MSSREKTGNIITFTHFLEGNISSKNYNNAVSSDESDNDSIIPPLLRKETIDVLDSGDKSDHNIINTEMSEDVRDWSQSHLNVNRREACYKIHDCIMQRKSEQKQALKYMRSISKGLHKVFKTVVKEISQKLQPLG